MLTDSDVVRLLDLVKRFVDASTIDFPAAGSSLEREVLSEDGHESFLIDVNRKGKVKPTKCTFQERYAMTDILYRLDIDGPPHTNPDGMDVPCPHLHVYRQGFADKWAFPIDPSEFTDTSNLLRTFRQFLTRCNVYDVPDIQSSLT
ncbi:MAG TPA: hypothetical protein VGN57_19085 [Pirellulaceae bacterium]|jgi:hypothetical protein|nr:hypothetical protein [Pirellulaceae bacterium]